MKIIFYSILGLSIIALDSMVLKAAELSAPASNSPWQQSYILEAKGDYEAATDVLSDYLDNTESSEMAWLRSGWLHYLQGDYNDAINAYKTAWKKNKYSLDARLGLTLPLMAQNRWKEAARYAQQVIDVSKSHYSANLRLLACQQGLKNWRDVNKLAKNLAARYPSETTPLVYLARAKNMLGDVDGAVTAYRQVLMREPGNIEAGQFVFD